MMSAMADRVKDKENIDKAVIAQKGSRSDSTSVSAMRVSNAEPPATAGKSAMRVSNAEPPATTGKAKQKLERGKLEKSSSSSGAAELLCNGWFYKHRYMLNRPFQLKAFATWTTINLAPLFFITIHVAATGKDACDKDISSSR
jgi:hypothetical protein